MTTKEEARFQALKGLVDRDRNMAYRNDFHKLAHGTKEDAGKLMEQFDWFEKLYHEGEEEKIIKVVRKKGDEEFEGKDPGEMLKQCYQNINDVIDYYMDVSEETRNIICLWIIGTYFHDSFSTFPYLFCNAMKGSGKTRLLKLIVAYAKDANLTASLTESVMFRTKGTLALDEFEGIGSKEKTSLRELLNSSYKKGTKIFRMAKKKGPDGETQVVEEFEPYRPVVLANIWGMEEVLGDRCITVLLEKSVNASKIKLVEDFEDLEGINYTKKMLDYLVRCSLCSVVSLRNIKQKWNDFIKHTYTPTTLTTLTTLNNTNYTEEDDNIKLLFTKINVTGIEGRYLELFFPLFLIAEEMSSVVLENTIHYAKKIVNDKKIEEITESKDVLVYSLIAKEEPMKWREIKDLTTIFKLIMGEDNEWLNTKWMGRSLKRLNLIKEKRRVGKGVQVILDVDKAKLKESIFKPEEIVEVKDDNNKDPIQNPNN